MHHMCEDNRDALRIVESKSDAIILYKKTIDWALEEGYPSIQTIRKHFSDCEADGVFVDREFHGEILKDQQVYVFHNCTGWIRTGLNMDKRIIPMLYFANGCEMAVKSASGDGRSIRVPLYIFGQNRISAEQSKDIYCVTYRKEVK